MRTAQSRPGLPGPPGLTSSVPCRSPLDGTRDSARTTVPPDLGPPSRLMGTRSSAHSTRSCAAGSRSAHSVHPVVPSASAGTTAPKTVSTPVAAIAPTDLAAACRIRFRLSPVTAVEGNSAEAGPRSRDTTLALRCAAAGPRTGGAVVRRRRGRRGARRPEGPVRGRRGSARHVDAGFAGGHAPGAHLLGDAQGLLDQVLHDLRLRHGLDDLALDEDLPLAVAGGHAQVGLAGLTGT